MLQHLLYRRNADKDCSDLSHYNPGTCYGNQITVFLVLREDLSILPQKDTILRMNDIMVIREENKK